eukprot:PITA_04115
MTPKEAFTGEKPHVGHLHIFVCLTYSYIPKEQRTTLEPMAEKGVFMGYNETSKAYQIFKQRVVIRKDVMFEEKRAYQRSREYDEKESETSSHYVAKSTNIVDSEPTSYEEAASQEVRREAMVEEYAFIIKNNVSEVVARPKGKLVVTSRWLYKIKHVEDGSIEKFKARFVARGISHIEGVDYDETFSPVVWYNSIWSLISIATEMGW